MKKVSVPTTLRHGIIAGVAGGLAEVAWVSLYSGLTGGDPAIVARGVTTAAGVGALLPASAASLGVAVHMTLAIALGAGLAFAWRAFSANRAGSSNPYAFMLAALTGVWAVNFFVILPIIDPTFIHLVSYPVSLTSKLLFGMAAAEALRRQAAPQPAAHRAFFVGRVS